MSDRNHSLFTGVVPSTGIRVPSVAEAQADLDRHQAARPDHLKALHPLAPKALRDEFTTWCERKEILQARLEMAKNRVAQQPLVIHREQPLQFRGISHEARVAYGRMGGRPRSANPSPRALRRRAEREKQK